MADTATAVPKPLRLEVAGAKQDIFVPVFGGILRPQDDLLLTRGSGRGLKIYDDLERDAQVGAVIQKRKLAVIAREFEVEPGAPGRAATKAADLVKRALEGFDFDKASTDLLDAILKGYAVGEVMWEVRDGWVLPKEIIPRDQRRFVFDLEGKPRLLTWSNMWEGEDLPDRKFVVHRFGSKNADPYGLGLGHRLFWPVFFKRQGITFWLVFCEKFGSPTVVGLFPPGTSPQDQDDLLATLSGIAQQSAVTAPDGTKIDLLEASRSGSVTYPDLCRYMDEQISVAVLGETLTTNIGSVGSKAAADTHNGVREELTDADADLLSGSLNGSLVKWIVDLNLPGAPYPAVWRPRPAREEEEEAVKQARLDRLIKSLAYMRLARADGYVPEASDVDLEAQAIGKWIYRGPPPTLPPVPAGPSFADPSNPARPRDAVDDLADQLDQVAAPVMGALIGQLKVVVDSSASMAEVADRLVGLYPQMDAGPLAELMAQAMAVAEMTGRAEIVEVTR